MNDRSSVELFTTPQAAALFNLNRFYAAELAKKSVEAGREWPKKKGRTYVAPLSEWKKIFHPEGKHLRKPRNEPVIRETVHPKAADLISCTKAAKRYGISRSWALKLARRSYQSGNPIPLRSGRMWLATMEQWQQIFEDPRLRKWIRRKNFRKNFRKI